MTFIICPDCQGSGTSSAYLGSFTSDDMMDMDPDFAEDYFGGKFDRACENCKGQRVVTACATTGCTEPQAILNGYFGRHTYEHCWEHDEDARSSAEDEAVGAAERAFGC